MVSLHVTPSRTIHTYARRRLNYKGLQGSASTVRDVTKDALPVHTEAIDSNSEGRSSPLSSVLFILIYILLQLKLSSCALAINLVAYYDFHDVRGYSLVKHKL